MRRRTVIVRWAAPVSIAMVVWLAITIVLDNTTGCKSTRVTIINDTWRAIPNLVIRNINKAIWRTWLPPLRVRHITLPLKREGVLTLDAEFDGGGTLKTEIGWYVAPGLPETTVFIVRRAQIDIAHYDGPVRFWMDAKSESLELGDQAFRYLGCPIRVALIAI